MAIDDSAKQQYDVGRFFYFTNPEASSSESDDVNHLPHERLSWVDDDVQISDDPSKVIAGRGLINGSGSNRTIQPGDLLFVITPTVSVDIDQVLRVYRGGSHSHSRCSDRDGSQQHDQGRTRLEQIAETILLKKMKRYVKKYLEGGEGTQKDTLIALSLLSLTNGDDNHKHRFHSEIDSESQSGFLKRILMGDDKDEVDPQYMQQSLTTTDQNVLDDECLLKIIRHNAFGPDFHNYGRMEREINAGNHSCYRRILAHYPLAAMINHSCTSNAQRVYAALNGTEVMIATASRPIKPGQEIVWSYIPPIIEYNARMKQLQGFGFECRCQRCQAESKVHLPDDLLSIQHHNQPQLLGLENVSIDEWRDNVQALESFLKHLDNTTARSIRLGWTHFYLNYFNTALRQRGNEQDVLLEAMKLHFAFVEVHNACTEHLSILHLCYDLAGTTSGGSLDATQQLKKRKMFIEALKAAHVCRYSRNAFLPVDDSTERLRALLAHTKIILRNQNGWKMSADTIERFSQATTNKESYQVKMKSPII